MQMVSVELDHHQFATSAARVLRYMLCLSDFLMTSAGGGVRAKFRVVCAEWLPKPMMIRLRNTGLERILCCKGKNSTVSKKASISGSNVSFALAVQRAIKNARYVAWGRQIGSPS